MNQEAQGKLSIQGRVAPGFERVRETFAAGFARDDAYQELGAALSVYRAGAPVVELWGGHTDAARTRAWQRDTLVNVYSTTKGLVATAVAMLVEQGRLDYADPVVKHWPEYGQAGKAATTVAQLLSHQAGLTGFVPTATQEDLYEWTRCCERLAAQAPCWPPGAQTSYHAMTWGYLAGELVRRCAGVSVGQFLAERIAGPLAADLFIGLPAAQDARVATLYGPKTPPDLASLTQPPEALLALFSPQLDPEVPNQHAWRAAEIPAANGLVSADGLARLYGALAAGGALDGVRLLSRAGIGRMLERQAGRTDLLLGFQDNWAMGMTFNQFGMLGPRAETFGHGGWGGSVGCADLETQVGIGYVCNQMGAQLVGDPRATALCTAVFECL
ncbi:MAG TPA: serine hydrolase domain-containing protein [Solimonas sp.]|nr:serine hydrolase domain-containing protein [Solimonas sp.]